MEAASVFTVNNVTDTQLAPALQRNPWVRDLYFASKGFFRLRGSPPRQMLSDLTLDGRPVILSHAPKAGGTSLRHLLGTRGMTHSMPALVLTERYWQRAFVIASVRHPFDRFVSGYAYHILGPYRGTLFRTHGVGLKALDPFEYLAFISQYPEKLGPLMNWTHYPSRAKPRADVILHIEQSASWFDQLRGAGLDLAGRSLERRNASRATGESKGALLALPDDELERLHRLVRDAYARDYEEFGYEA